MFCTIIPVVEKKIYASLAGIFLLFLCPKILMMRVFAKDCRHHHHHHHHHRHHCHHHHHHHRHPGDHKHQHCHCHPHFRVGWEIIANHGGGYSYRLCKDDQELTEECFQVNIIIFIIIPSLFETPPSKLNFLVDFVIFFCSLGDLRVI